MKQPRIILSGGGTGGHIFPAIAIANALKEKRPDAVILFVGADKRMEMERVPAAGYEIVGLPVRGFNRSRLLSNVSVLVDLLRSLLKARRLVRQFKPDVAVGVGGYASGPLLRAAAAAGVPTLIQEQNSYAGVTNKLLAAKAAAICVAYPDMERFFPKEKILLTGNPVRSDLLQALDKRGEALEAYGLDPSKRTLLVMGGSLGARTLNESVIAGLDQLAAATDVQVIWQTGRYYHASILERLEGKIPANVRVLEFLQTMNLAYAAADLIVSRAGASSISECCLLSKPVILVPSPNVAEDHQTRNAMALVKEEAAVLIPDAEAVQRLIPEALSLIHSPVQLKALSTHIVKLAQYDSDKRIADKILDLIPSQS
ncbi:MAG: undecaprenyldiphospho-muramoylpentapeptide beta-N-acetylglucosaminyltransferase [Bacteroidales bacterium]|jgi:UDP-N-acetylglucosamine--N-acetylmuramyl-(pentapeptide) pyrophosphoryl-undecaprenol N-acetylglucosamine transferase|nr:undecaprenyldiphospho-muramoylpentapeptide beta-N-acetylglucosaminyltransferase [Bacteroidales bacterium]OPZ98401.1 MAG: UDP-N-acetylglucosamine--N-acetylmuramyl-(pentapeptide) pyrophosphoryl-undecaprenol N-acetylglucosamine transferase [Bacteroidetes bacterium ADurb.Bin416]